MVLRFFLLAILFLFISCADFERDNPYDPDGVDYIGNRVSYGSETYEGETYNTVVIGSQTWMAENLNYNTSGGKCYNNNESNCKIYGRLYDWATAMGLPSSCNSSNCASQVGAKHKGICPNGWHIPSAEEWGILIEFVGGSSAGRYLKALTGWDRDVYGNDGNGEDKYGFSALPAGGYDDDDGSFYDVGSYGDWWSSSEDRSDYADYRGINRDGYVWYISAVKSNLKSVRCIKD